MSNGILRNKDFREFYEKLNKRPYCNSCWEERISFEIKDKKDTDSYSNMIPGFSSNELTLPIEILIIAKAHGGGRKDSFRKQIDLKTELELLENYYLSDKLVKFHQEQMRSLFNYLNKKKINWVFTDLIKCFVWHGNEDGLNGNTNFNKAISHCKSYLTKQINYLKPKVILSLGDTVSNSYFNIPKPVHGELYQIGQSTIVHSTFPSGFTADRWVERGGWKKVTETIAKHLKIV